MGKQSVGFLKATGHPLEVRLSNFLLDNQQWILSCGATVSFQIIGKPWAEAAMLVTTDGKHDESAMRKEVNRRLVAAGFKTNLPQHDRRADGHVITNWPAKMIEILGWAKSAGTGI